MSSVWRTQLVADLGCDLGESPSWDANSDKLLSVDINGKTIFILDASGTSTGENTQTQAHPWHGSEVISPHSTTQHHTAPHSATSADNQSYNIMQWLFVLCQISTTILSGRIIIIIIIISCPLISV
jgi:hypothetical protein